MSLPLEPPRSDPPSTTTRTYPRFRTLVLLSILAVVPAFTATGVVVRLHRDQRQRLASDWVRTAEAHLGAGRPLEAAEAYRTALSYSRENPVYQLRLARALVSADRLPEARAYLVNLANRDPSQGAVNLELARVAARQDEHQTAVQHYRRAIDGYWADDATGQRRSARVELSSFLLQHGDRAAAVAELMALAADLPADAAQYTRTAQELAAAGAHVQALELFRRALEIDTRYAPAMLGAGRSAFALADYPTAQRYLVGYERTADGADEESGALLETLEYLSQVNAREARLSIAERAQRASRAFEIASQRFACMTRPDDKQVRPYGYLSDAEAGLARRMEATGKNANIRHLRRNPDDIDLVFELALEAARAAARRCGPPTGADLALLTLAQQTVDRR
jgi:thioredoxin-like negative regulator of GroEL